MSLLQDGGATNVTAGKDGEGKGEAKAEAQDQIQPECATRADTYNSHQIPANCPSSKFPVGQKFCVNGETYTVTKSWDSSLGPNGYKTHWNTGSTVNHERKPGRKKILKGTKITFGGCGEAPKVYQKTR